ncbi:hypothetical protein DL770_006794 [Monosporascus sp. CRB-9-2]|nr:hypothetical protein DL770_006794 [Monosporascus sp. CRB-9-2]
MAGSENCGLVAAETANPKRSAPRVVGSIWLRLALFYMLGSLMVTINLSLYHSDLSGGEGTNALPFVIAYRDGGAHPLAYMINIVILIPVTSTGAISGYGGSRTTMGLAALGIATRRFMTTEPDRPPVVRPRADFYPWRRPCVPSPPVHPLRLGHDLFIPHPDADGLGETGPHGGGATLEELALPVRCMVRLDLRIVPIVVQFHPAVSPLDASRSAEGFFANYVSVILIIVLWLGARVHCRGNWWVDMNTVGLDNGHRLYRGNDVEKAPAKGFLGKMKVVGYIFS